jgi:tRNA uridine 5-carboxymethylaminomethyl modification enzyme
LWVFQQSVDDLTLAGDKVTGVITQAGIVFEANAVVLTTGTFLDGKIHVGLNNFSAGRAGDPPAIALSARLKELKLPQGRLKTGTPPRLDGRTIDFSRCEEQPGDGVSGGMNPDQPIPVFSFMGSTVMHPQQLSCWITHTNEKTHEIIRSGFDRSPMFTGVIEGVGPRYCPSVEDKINRFADKSEHQIFLEPEGLSTHEFYPNGISTSLPFDIQYDLVRSIKGLENAHIVRPGYAIEYDYFDPQRLTGGFESQAIRGLFFAGQINGTTGYEEAAAQGLFAGINAALLSSGEAPWRPARNEAYLGVLVDDLITKGVTEPYRMFTSRAEYRLQLREDNADLRLTETGRRLGLVNDFQWKAFARKQEAVSRETQRLKTTWVNPKNLPEADAIKVLGSRIEHEYNLFDLLKRPGVQYEAVVGLGGEQFASAAISQETYGLNHQEVIAQLDISAKYAGYIDRQRNEIERAAYYERLPIPAGFDYQQVSGLSVEVKQKLSKAHPETLGAASRVSGVTPAAISLLLIYLKKMSHKGMRAKDEASSEAI